MLAPSLMDILGCGVLSAAVLIGETAGVHRFRNKDAYARFTGTAPIPVWSGASAGKVRLNRGGNRATNCALHMIAVTQARGIGPGHAYLAKQQARGKDKTASQRPDAPSPMPSSRARLPPPGDRGLFGRQIR